MRTEIVPEGRYIPVALTELGIVAHWVLAPDGAPFLAIRKTCEELGVSVQGQLEKLTADDAYNDPDILREFRIETGGGRQVTKCLRRAEAAIWIATIKPGKTKPALAGKIALIRRAVMHVAEQLIFGDMTGALTVSSPPARGGDLDAGGCPVCHTHLGHHIGPDGNWLYRVESEK